ncbi:MAG: hypothetical protein E7526_01065 [Ruminococcaceae bacterium]|nr:hypothetical protein [Oscillospiraceae bacterium]
MKNKIIATVLVATVFLALCGCKSNDNDDIAPYGASDKWEKVEKSDMPARVDATLTFEKMEELYRPHTDWRIYDIRTTETTVKPIKGGTAYYVSNKGNSANDGLTPETPLASVYNLGKVKLTAGDVVYFERGSVFRGTWTAMVDGVTYSAYGEGKKPEFYGSIDNYADPKYWQETDKKGVYVCTEHFFKDVGAIILNERTSATKIAVGSNGIFEGKQFSGYKDITKNLYFYHDKQTGKLYFKCSGNPGEIYDRIELNLAGTIVSVRANDITLDNLCIKYGGSHGVGSSDGHTGLTIQNCEIGFIGGAVHSDRNGWAIRFGNGVEIWGATENFTIKNSYFYDIYDAAMTFQYSTSTSPAPETSIKNVNFVDNVIERCTYSVEYFLTSGDNSFIENITIANNLMWYTGEGYCFKRYGQGQDAHIKSWEHNTNYHRGYYNITNNLFAMSKAYLVQSWSGNTDGAKYDSNIYIQTENQLLGENGKTTQKIMFDKNVKKAIKEKLYDNNATVIWVTE